MPATIIADDLTGACDAGALFCGRGRVGVFFDDRAPGPEWEVAVVDSESRALPAAEAARAVSEIAQRLGPRLRRGLVFKKIDSTLRGAVGAELDVLLNVTGRRAALVCPAFPAQGRTVVDGILRVGGVPAHESPIGRDPDYPTPFSDVADILRRGGRPVRRVALREVRGGALPHALEGATGGVLAADAETDADLDALAAAAAADASMLLAGSAGLARATAAALAYAGGTVPLPEGRAWLIVAGSRHPASRSQTQALRAAGMTSVIVESGATPDVAPLIAALRSGGPALLESGDTPDDRSAVAARLARSAATVLSAARPDLVAVTGGDTARALLRALGATRLELVGAPSSGLALGDIVVNGMSTLPLLTKAGGFGAPDLLLALLKGAR
ncbi:MAG TPA: four-carbon acid sugar kinase family protein [Methylomirabilota bacterium]|nr:four-carbon acid sugar kinase family protein [Methylomirabilota bacterium]